MTIADLEIALKPVSKKKGKKNLASAASSESPKAASPPVADAGSGKSSGSSTGLAAAPSSKPPEAVSSGNSNSASSSALSSAAAAPSGLTFATASASAVSASEFGEPARASDGDKMGSLNFEEDYLDDANPWIEVGEERKLSLNYKKLAQLQLRIIEIVNEFNKLSGVRIDLIIGQNDERKLPVFYFKVRGCLHLTIGPNGIHFSYEKIREGRHIHFRLVSSNTRALTGAFGAASAATTEIRIVPKYLNSGSYSELTPAVVNTIYSPLSASGGAGARASDCDFTREATILLDCVIYVLKRCNGEGLITGKKGGDYYEKYLKYKQKYLSLRKMLLRNP